MVIFDTVPSPFAPASIGGAGGRKIEEELDLGDNVVIVSPEDALPLINRAPIDQSTESSTEE